MTTTRTKRTRTKKTMMMVTKKKKLMPPRQGRNVRKNRRVQTSKWEKGMRTSPWRRSATVRLNSSTLAAGLEAAILTTSHRCPTAEIDGKATTEVSGETKGMRIAGYRTKGRRRAESAGISANDAAVKSLKSERTGVIFQGILSVIVLFNPASVLPDIIRPDCFPEQKASRDHITRVSSLAVYQ